MRIDVSKKVIVITGASKGIGASLAWKFAKEQAYVVINYFHSESQAIELYKKICQFNSNCILVKADVTKPEEVRTLYKRTINRYGKIDTLINNTGICDDNLVQLMTIKQWNRVINTNLNGTFLCSREFSKTMIRQKQGKIINIASLKGQEGCIGQANYASSKAGIIALTKTMAKELGKYNIAVNAFCPGFIITDLNKDNKIKLNMARDKSVMRIDTLIDDLISMVLLFSSNRISGVSGRIFNLDSRIN